MSALAYREVFKVMESRGAKTVKLRFRLEQIEVLLETNAPANKGLVGIYLQTVLERKIADLAESLTRRKFTKGEVVRTIKRIIRNSCNLATLDEKLEEMLEKNSLVA